MLTRLSLKFKLTALVVTLVAVGTYSLGKYAFSGVLDVLERALGQGAAVTARVMADEVDPQWLETMDIKGDPDATYKQLEKRLQGLVADRGVERMELVRIHGRESVERIINVPIDGSPDYTSPGTQEPYGEPYTQSPQGNLLIRLNSSKGAMAGWQVIKNGEVPVGAVIAYLDAEDLQANLTRVNIGLSIIFILLPLCAGSVTYMITKGFEKTAVTDGLMGIYNHKYFKQRLEQEVAKSARYGVPTSLVLLDIDFFKRVNDTYGHATGDIVLRMLAKIISDSSRNTDVVCRYGGEEIVVILTHTGLAGAQEFAERLRMKISEHVVRDPGENAEFRVTVSVGVAQWEKGIDMMGLIRRTDAALYQSKHNGRNRVTIYQDDIFQEAAPTIGGDQSRTQAAATVEHVNKQDSQQASTGASNRL